MRGRNKLLPLLLLLPLGACSTTSQGPDVAYIGEDGQVHIYHSTIENGHISEPNGSLSSLNIMTGKFNEPKASF